MLSGGLDSSLAVKIVADQGIEVVGVNYNTGFCLTDHRRKMYGMGAQIDLKSVRNAALAAGARWGLPVEIIDISDDYLRILTKPRYGYGSAINPCIDCRIFMQKKTREYMEKIGAKFIITGEVVGQRPMSQMRKTLKLIEKESGCGGLILRPLSAKLLEPTVAEINGWVNREKLYDFHGRSRKSQIKLAKELGLGTVIYNDLSEPWIMKRIAEKVGFQTRTLVEVRQINDNQWPNLFFLLPLWLK